MGCAKVGVGGVVGAATGLLLAWTCFIAFCNRYPAPAQQIGDIGILVLYLLGALVFAVVLTLVGGIAGGLLARRYL